VLPPHHDDAVRATRQNPRLCMAGCAPRPERNCLMVAAVKRTEPAHSAISAAVPNRRFGIAPYKRTSKPGWNSHPGNSMNHRLPMSRMPFAANLECGILAHGFAPRTTVTSAGHDFLIRIFLQRPWRVPFLQHTAHGRKQPRNLTDHVFPKLPVRQWCSRCPNAALFSAT